MSMPQHRLLILDDDPEVGRHIGLIAERAGTPWRSVVRVQDFFLQLEQWQPTHLIIDLVMPEQDGVQIMRTLAERGCRARVAIISGVDSRVMDAAMRSGLEHGLDVRGVIPKPFPMGSVLAFLQQDAEQAPVAMGRGDAVQDALPLGGRDSDFSAHLWTAELERALESKQFTVEYQPKIHCNAEILAGFEALVRWEQPFGSPQLPARFIHLMEQSQLIEELTMEVFGQSIRWFATHFPESGISLSINISARNLVETRFVDKVLILCEQHSLDPQRIIFEVSESSAMEDPTMSLAALTRFRMKGFQLSIDDFGTGFSSMVQLVRLPFSEIKVDKSFVSSAVVSSESRAVVKSIVDLGHSLGLRTTAEGVEDQQTLRFIKSIGCDLAQGYFIARPMTGERVMDWINSKWGSTL
ncbi:MAG: EAL domain-containing response regulator [Pseudomonadota bacterium]